MRVYPRPCLEKSLVKISSAAIACLRSVVGCGDLPRGLIRGTPTTDSVLRGRESGGTWGATDRGMLSRIFNVHVGIDMSKVVQELIFFSSWYEQARNVVGIRGVGWLMWPPRLSVTCDRVLPGCSLALAKSLSRNTVRRQRRRLAEKQSQLQAILYQRRKA